VKRLAHRVAKESNKFKKYTLGSGWNREVRKREKHKRRLTPSDRRKGVIRERDRDEKFVKNDERDVGVDDD